MRCDAPEGDDIASNAVKPWGALQWRVTGERLLVMEDADGIEPNGNPQGERRVVEVMGLVSMANGEVHVIWSGKGPTTGQRCRLR